MISRQTRLVPRFLAVGCIVLEVACVSLGSGGRSGAPAPSSPEGIVKTAVAGASAALDTALLEGDTARIRASFADDGYFVRPQGDTVRGPGAIAYAIAHMVSTQSAQTSVVLFMRERDGCPSGGWDAGLYGVEQISADGDRASVLSGSYVVQWRMDSSARARVGSLTLLDGERPIGAAHGATRCHRFAIDHFDHRRLFVTGSFPGLAYTNNDTRAKAERTFAAEGWNTIGSRYVAGEPQTRPYQSDRSLLAETPRLSARVRVWRGLAVEGTAQFVAEAGTVSRQKTTDTEYLARFDEREGIALVSYEWHRLRLGMGAARVRVHWRELYSWVNYMPIRTVNNEQRWDNFSATGFAAQLAYARPIMSSLYFEGSVHTRRGPSRRMPPRTGYEAWSAHFDGNWAGLGLGLAF